MKRRISPATVIASLALFFSLTGAGIAATGYRITSIWQIAPKVRHELRGARGPEGAVGPAGSPAPAGASVLWADVAPSGLLDQGRDVITTSEQGDPSAPTYTVQFDRNVVVGCIRLQSEADGTEQTVVASPVSADTLQVQLYNGQGQPTAGEFQLIVIC